MSGQERVAAADAEVSRLERELAAVWTEVEVLEAVGKRTAAEGLIVWSAADLEGRLRLARAHAAWVAKGGGA
jgi:uncharacterized small protein (DUF1192 family)